MGEGGLPALVGLACLANLAVACVEVAQDKRSDLSTIGEPYTNGPTVSCQPPTRGESPIAEVNGYQLWQIRRVGTDDSGLAQILYSLRRRDLPCAFEIVSQASVWQLANLNRSLSVVPLGAWLEFGRLTAEMQKEADEFSAHCELTSQVGQYCGSDVAGVAILASNDIGGPQIGRFLIINGVVFNEDTVAKIARLDGR